MQWRTFCLLFFISTALSGEGSSWETQNEEETLFIRRIADFWQEGEYQIAKAQIELFLNDFSDSPCAEALFATLGDLYVREKNYREALSCYSKLSSKEELDHTFSNRMQCFLGLQWFATLADECETYLQRDDLDLDEHLRASYLLALSLYQQILNSPQEESKALATRAAPYFQELMQSSLAPEIAHAYAHFSFLTQNYETAASIYLKLAEFYPQEKEELLFQTALLQARYDKPLAIATFQKLSLEDSKRQADALYNSIVLSFECGKSEELFAHKEELLERLPEQLQSSLHLLFARALIDSHHYEDALQELSIYTVSNTQKEHLHSALVDLIDVSCKLYNEPTLSTSLKKLSESFPEDPQISKGMLDLVFLLKKNERYEEALQKVNDLLCSYPQSKEAKQALFEKVNLEYLLQQWQNCQKTCKEFLDAKISDKEQVIYAWHALVNSSSFLANEHPEAFYKEDLIKNLEQFLAQKDLFSPEEQQNQVLVLAKVLYERNNYEKAINLLETCLASEEAFPQKGNILLLLGLCYRDGLLANDQFSIYTEQALHLGANLLEKKDIHLSLFNSYLEQKSFDQARDHLFLASELGAENILEEHLLWLASSYYEQFCKTKEDLVLATKIEKILKHYLNKAHIDLQQPRTDLILKAESSLAKLTEIQGFLGKEQEQMDLLLAIKQAQEQLASAPWQETEKINFLLAERYQTRNEIEKARTLLNQILEKNPTLRSSISASACLQSVRLQKDTLLEFSKTNPQIITMLSQLKTLILQRSLANEPVYLEAACEYIDLQCELETEKNLFQKELELLISTKETFESTSDLLAKDYQTSRKILPEKDAIYCSYLRLFEADIFLCKFLLAKDEQEQAMYRSAAKKMYEKLLMEKTVSFVHERAKKHAKRLDL